MLAALWAFDSLAAEAVIDQRKENRDIRLVIVIPCRDQAVRWSSEQKKRHERINHTADKVICLAEHYYLGCMHERSRYMVDHSQACICYLTERYTVQYAREHGLKIFHMAKQKSETQ